MADIININTKQKYIPSNEIIRKDSKSCLENVLKREPRTVIVLSWNGKVDEGFDIDYNDLGQISDLLAVLEIAKAKLLKENYS